MTNIEFVSQISGILKSNNKDNKIPKRLILKVGQDVATFLISQKLMDRTISSETNLFTTIPCFELEQIESKNCPSIEFRLCKTLMKSKCPLPKLVFSRLGASIRDIVGCGAGAPSFPSEITSAICYQNIISHDNTIDNIII